MMGNLAKDKQFKYHPKCKKLNLNHLCFADDLMIFTHGDKVSIKSALDMFNTFSSKSGLFPNLEKSNIFLAGLSDPVKAELLTDFRMKEGRFPIRYLGVPPTSGKLSNLGVQILG